MGVLPNVRPQWFRCGLYRQRIQNESPLMAMKVEVTVADIVRSLLSGVISERIAVRKLETIFGRQVKDGYLAGYEQAVKDAETAAEIMAGRADEPLVNEENL